MKIRPSDLFDRGVVLGYVIGTIFTSAIWWIVVSNIK